MNKREILVKLIKDGKEAEQKLAELDKPELMHGDCWIVNRDDGKARMYAKKHNSNKEDCIMLSDCLITNIGSTYKGEPIIGNIKDFFTDFKRNSEDLKEFEIKQSFSGNKKIKVGLTIDPENMVFLMVKKEDTGGYVVSHLNLNEFAEFCQKSGQLLAYAKRQKAKGE